MADAQRTIDLIFNGVDKTGAATQAVIKNLSGFGDKVETATQPIADFTKGALKLEAGILAAGAALTLFAVNEAAKFESAMLDLQKVLGEADGSIEGFADAAVEISTQYGIASTDVLASIANFKQAGFTGAEALQLVRNALDLKIAGDIEAARSSDLLVASIKGFGLEAKSAGQIVDLLNEVSNRYATNVDELATGFAILSPVAKAAGLSLEETAGVLTPGIEVFRSGSEVANALRTVLLRLQDDSKPVQEALAALGVSQRDTNGELRTARDIYFDVAKAFGGLSDSQKTYYAAQLAGLDQSAKFIAVMEGIGKTTAIAGKDFDYLGSAAKEVEVRLSSTQAAVDKAQVSFSNLAKVIGAPLLDEFKGIADAVAAIFQTLGKSAKEGELGGLVAYIESVAGDIEDAFLQVAKNLPAALDGADLSGFKDGIDAVLSAVKALFGGLDVTSTEGLTKSIEFLGAAFLGLSKYAAGVIDSFKPMFDLLVKVGQGAADVDADVFQLAGNIGGAVTQINLLAGGLNTLMPSLEALLGIMVVKQGAGLVGAMGSLSSSAGLLTKALGAAGLVGAAGAAGYAIGTALNDPINKLVSSLTGSETTLGAWIYDLVNAGNEAEALGVTVGGVKVSLDELNKGVESGRFVWDDVTQSWTLAGKASGQLADGLDGVAGAVKKVTYGPVTEYLDALGNVVERTVSSAAALAEWNAAILANGGVMEESAARVDKFGKEIQTTGLIIDAATGAILGYYGAFENLSKADQEALLDQKAFGVQVKDTGAAASKTADELKKAEEATRRWNEEVAKMDHAEKLKLIEAQTTISVARIEADAQKAIAAFESLGTSITSTGETLSSLYGTLAGGDLDFRQQLGLERELEKESKRRDDALKLQRDLTDAQIRMMDAQVAALQKGDGLIKVDGAGLQPHLEAFMWEILKSIQVRVNQDGLKMLLGV